METDRHHVPDADRVGVHAGRAPRADRRVRQQHGRLGGRHEQQGDGDRGPHDRGGRQPQLPVGQTVAGHAGVQGDQGRAGRGAGEHTDRVEDGAGHQGDHGLGARAEPHRRGAAVGQLQPKRLVQNRLQRGIDTTIS